MSEQTDIQHLDPDSLVKGFSKTAFVRFLLVSVVLHIVIIGGTSVGFVLNIVNPPEAAAG